jgi:hypothetical protein
VGWPAEEASPGGSSPALPVLSSRVSIQTPTTIASTTSTATAGSHSGKLRASSSRWVAGATGGAGGGAVVGPTSSAKSG